MKAVRRLLADQRHRPALWLVLAGLMLRALIPVGYMFNYAAAEGEGFVIVLCPTGLDPDIAHTLGLHHGLPGEDTHREAPCVFAAVAALAVSLILLGLLVDLWPALARWLLPRDEAFRHPALQDPRRARAPPLSL